MKELVKHIEILLFDHDCVVVPQIGGFVTRDIPAKYVEEENLFLPPIRTVGFNERLKADDGLLMRSYMEAYHCSEGEARAMLGEQIRDLQQELWETGTYDMGSIGVLTLGEGNGMEFSPCQAGTVCPAYYGLDALLFEPLRTENANEAAPDAEAPRPASAETSGAGEAAEERGTRGVITIRLKKSWLQDIAAVAAVVLLFFLISPDAKNTGFTSDNRAEFARLMRIPAERQTMPAVFDKPETTSGTDKATDAEKPESPAGKPEATQKADTPAAAEGGYCIVLASAISEKNANSYVERLHKEGYKEAQVYKKRNMVRVIFPEYASEQEAYGRLHVLRRLSEKFQSAWVYHIK